MSDDDDDDDTTTTVLLGLPDGPIHDPSDITDVAVSRIGGHPVRRPVLPCLFFLISSKAFLPSSELPFHASQCKSCSFPMPLLLQIWCPFEDSPMDRALYVWGCSRGPCQIKSGR